jgi:hypothetical protein
MAMFAALGELAAEGRLLAPAHAFIPLEQYREALEKTLAGFLPAKYIFRLAE